ncbi:hypothetical protein KC678_00160 [Candidatus Dojkabacteria bacterium]|uniref:Uncharacterized protein n=1 Tax=Candidatus Dojkabacteria bacterium TaxID=2099670 RepID=A0A955I8N1_9BACT|nr:hypothetical protein [Candidatus Dojkabacteria bacterium]
MYRIKLATTSPDIVTFLFRDFVNYQTEEPVEGIQALTVHSIFEATEMPIILKQKESDASYAFFFLPLLEELVGLPVEVEDNIFYIKYGDNRVGVLEQTMDELVEIIEEYIEELPPIKPQPFFHPLSKLEFNVGEHVLIFGNDDFKIYRSRSVLPTYTLITENTAQDPDFNGQKFVVPLELLGEDLYAFVGSGFRAPIEQYVGDLENNFSENMYTELIEKIKSFNNLTDDSKAEFNIVLEEESNEENS